MDTGMLWFDNDAGQSLTGKIDRAAEHYRSKYGRKPSLCFVHPTMLPAEESRSMAGAVEIRTAPWVLPNHFFIGVSAQEP
jgi:hypothetical protein